MIVDGAELLESRTDRYVRRAMFLSADRSVLAVVGEGRHGLYRVELLRRHKDPYYPGRRGVEWQRGVLGDGQLGGGGATRPRRGGRHRSLAASRSYHPAPHAAARSAEDAR